MGVSYDCAAISASHTGADDRRERKVTAGIAQKIYNFRRRRNMRFEGLAQFEDPVWDILLTIYIDEAAERPVSITSACMASHVAPTTALRHIARLEQTGALEREDDPYDRRRSFLRLSPETRARMDTLLSAF